MKKILYILCFILTGSSAFLVSCDKPEELTPKVDNTSEDYLLPTGSILNAQDREEVQPHAGQTTMQIKQRFVFSFSKK